jgi:hypothetical protein
MSSLIGSNLISSIETWLHEVCTDSELGPCKAVALVHMAGTIQEDVYAKQIPAKIDAESVSDWAELFCKKAEQYAEGLPGVQTFSLLSFHGEGKKPGIRKTFPVKGYVEHDGLLTENPTGKGVLQQMMRLVNDLAGIYARKDQALYESMLRRLDLETRQNMSLRQENVQMFEFSKELVLKLSDRTHEHRLAQIEAQTSADLKREVLKNAPLLLETVTGRQVLPAHAQDSLLIERFIDALASSGPDELMTMSLKDLPPPLLAALADRFQKGIAARQKEQEVRKSVDESDRPIDGGLQ